MATFIAGSGSGHQNKKFGKVSTQEHADFLGVVGLSADDVTERLRIAALPPAQAAAARAAAPANAHASPVAR